MKTVIIETIDSYPVIKAFDRPALDPVETRKATEAAIEGDPLLVQKANLITEREALLAEMAPKMAALIEHDRNNTLDSPAAQQIQADLSALDQQVGSLVVQIQDLIAQLEVRYKELKAENLVYFEPKAGEEIITEAEYDTLKAASDALTEHQALCRDQTVIDDYRKVKYWKKDGEDWNHGIITQIGQAPPAGFKTPEELTQEEWTEIRAQLEEERIVNLTSEAREAEKQAKLTYLLIQAEGKKNFECDEADPGYDDCVAAVQTWYDTEKAIIEAKYTV